MSKKKFLITFTSFVLAIPITIFAMNVVGNNGMVDVAPQSMYSSPTINTNQPGVSGGGFVSSGGTIGSGVNTSGTFHVPGIAVGIGGSYLIENNGVAGVQNNTDTSVVSGEMNNTARTESLEKKNINTQIVDGALIINGQGNADGLSAQDMKDIFRPEGINTFPELKIWAEDYVGNDLRIKRLYYKDTTLDITYTLNSKLFGFINRKYDLLIHADTSAHTYNLRKPRWVVLSKNDLNTIGLSFSQIVPNAFSIEILAKMEKNSSYDNVAYMIEVLNHTIFSALNLNTN